LADNSPGPGRVCAAHNLPLGPDGKCIQCKREYELSQMAQSRSGYQIFVNVLGVLLVMGGCAAVGYFFIWPWWERFNHVPADEMQGPLESEDDHASAATTDEPGVERRWGRPKWLKRTHKPRARRPKTKIHTTRRSKHEVKSSLRAPDDVPKVKIIRPETDPRKLGVAGASRRVRVKVYVTSWCPACRKARKWLRRKNISHTLYDVERNRTARMELRSINPRGSIPTFKIGRQVLVGFSPGAVTRAIMRAAR